MRLFMYLVSLALAGAVTMMSGAMSNAAAMSAPARLSVVEASNRTVVKVHGRSHDRVHHYHVKHRHKTVVDAPFTRVRTGRRVEVDAPFTSVTVNRHGRHVRAPFVDLWLPRGR